MRRNIVQKKRMRYNKDVISNKHNKVRKQKILKQVHLKKKKQTKEGEKNI